MMEIRFTFDMKNWYSGDVGEESVDRINDAVWILLHTLGAKQVHIARNDLKKREVSVP